jgi:hypothetical protein
MVLPSLAMNTTDLLLKLTAIRSSSLDDIAKCRQAIDALAGELRQAPASFSIPGAVKRQLLEQLDELYARAMQRQLLEQRPSTEDHRFIRR